MFVARKMHGLKWKRTRKDSMDRRKRLLITFVVINEAIEDHVEDNLEDSLEDHLEDYFEDQEAFETQQDQTTNEQGAPKRSTCASKILSRSKMKEPHVTGTKSFARLAHEVATKNNGVYPTRGEMYITTRTHKDGSIVDDKAVDVVASLKSIASDSTSTSGDPDDFTNDDYSKVKGQEKRGNMNIQVPGIGSSVRNSSSSVNEISSSRSHNNKGGSMEDKARAVIWKQEVQTCRRCLRGVLERICGSIYVHSQMWMLILACGDEIYGQNLGERKAFNQLIFQVFLTLELSCHDVKP
ncbi:hypothetical protein QVD17_38071 [Tagetes erecta]|uniref:Uncharacterized protein n=1 Tax=Tagetes erecta TaxID=13708 RepID=A0AAD8JZF8_TARER|nr:hypothetical protein QVD17_38071 [Tagetes erecta]